MMKKYTIEVLVGLLMLLAAASLIFLALKVSGLNKSSLFGGKTYQVNALFNNIGSLKVNAPVRLAGVEIGTVGKISLDKDSYQALVIMNINDNINNLPDNSSAQITSTGLLGDNYVNIMPGFSSTNLKNDSRIITTYSATDIQSLISTFVNGEKKDAKKV